jgi:hypothetical protein
MRTLGAAALLLCLLVAARTGVAGETVEEVERDLAAVLREMRALEAEMDLLEETAAIPKATGIRLEIHRAGEVDAPARGRVLVGGKVEHEREWPAADRHAFSGRPSAPAVFLLPCLPGEYAGRFELFHPAWSSPPAADFRATVKKGEILTVRLRLALPAGKRSPSLTLVGEK